MDNNENNVNEKYLPLGTIVKLKTGTKKVMITGFCMYDNNNGHKLYDYCGCLYPEGMLSNREAHLFNHSDIEKVCHLGVSDEEEKKFKVNLTSMIQIIQTVSVEPEKEINYEPEEDKPVFEIK